MKYFLGGIAAGIILSLWMSYIYMVENNLKIAINVLGTISSGVVGAFIALWLDTINNPRLEIISGDEANVEVDYPAGYTVQGRTKFFRLKILNKKLPRWCTFIFNRETAEHLDAKITFKEIKKTMKGRWASTLELPIASPLDINRLANYPDPANISAGESEILDVFVRFDSDTVAYGWNNEAYLSSNMWRTSNYTLGQGDYTVVVVITGLNTKLQATFTAHIGATIDDCTLIEIKR